MKKCSQARIGIEAFEVLCRQGRSGRPRCSRPTETTSGCEADRRVGGAACVTEDVRGRGTELVNVTRSRVPRAMENEATGAEAGTGR